ncbi:MAG TPA: hypothetical protein VF076_07090 [Acidimicrobiales bacterium]
MKGLPVSGISPRSNGSPEGDAFIGIWNRVVREERERKRRRRALLARLDMFKIIPNDGWVDRVEGVPTQIPVDHPYGEYHTLKVGERVGIGSIGDERELMVGVYRVVSIGTSIIPGCEKAQIAWDRDVNWDAV